MYIDISKYIKMKQSILPQKWNFQCSSCKNEYSKNDIWTIDTDLDDYCYVRHYIYCKNCKEEYE